MKDKPRLLSRAANGRWVIQIDRRVRTASGESQRRRIKRMLPPGTTVEEAEAIAARMEAETVVKAQAIAADAEWEAYVASLSDAPKSWIYATMMNCRQRAKQKGIQCTLTTGQIRTVMLRSGGRCELTGLRFTLENPERARARPFFHSLDRIDSSAGYTIDNVRLVCSAANIALNAWGEDVFRELACGYVFNKYAAFYALRDRV